MTKLGISQLRTRSLALLSAGLSGMIVLMKIPDTSESPVTLTWEFRLFPVTVNEIPFCINFTNFSHLNFIIF